jgi:hypothetical protein
MVWPFFHHFHLFVIIIAMYMNRYEYKFSKLFLDNFLDNQNSVSLLLDKNESCLCLNEHNAMKTYKGSE